ncbi:uncharacterized protein EAF01_007527 [Botrytis porri]|uniref:uncharacterized protein n=1 Tax=Botrytis porri TaxID=87229 RepID=UPI00190000F2|nr:uncharacterized protein EAF01_007527 [Botrytis porri]KAF7900225.1 hypothetical protein EAF01_007527 [Botrytis porri]
MGFNQRILQMFKYNKPFTYAELDTSRVNSDTEYQDEDGLLNRFSVGDESLENAEKGDTDTCYKHHSFVRCLGWLNGLFFCLSLYLFTAAMLNWKQVPGGKERNWALKQVSEKSPILDAIDIPLSTWRLNGTFLERENESIYRQPPSPEVDAAWARIETQILFPSPDKIFSTRVKTPISMPNFPNPLDSAPTPSSAASTSSIKSTVSTGYACISTGT